MDKLDVCNYAKNQMKNSYFTYRFMKNIKTRMNMQPPKQLLSNLAELFYNFKTQ